jgi:hypothetical protein
MGVNYESSTLRPDNKANARIYGRKITARAILNPLFASELAKLEVSPARAAVPPQ